MARIARREILDYIHDYDVITIAVYVYVSRYRNLVESSRVSLQSLQRS